MLPASIAHLKYLRAFFQLKETQADRSFQQQVGSKHCPILTLEVQTLQSWQIEAP